VTQEQGSLFSGYVGDVGVELDQLQLGARVRVFGEGYHDRPDLAELGYVVGVGCPGCCECTPNRPGWESNPDGCQIRVAVVIDGELEWREAKPWWCEPANVQLVGET
jgi:hypothetical protein